MKTRGMRKSLSAAAAFVALAVALGGCGVRHYTRSDFDIHEVRKMAVLPMENFTKDAYAGEKIREAVITEVLARGVDVVEPGEVTRVLRETNIRFASPPVEDVKKLGKALKVDAVMTGSVEAFGISKGISVSYPEVTIHLMLYDTVSGNVVWSLWHTSGGPTFWNRHFGTEVLSLSEAARKVVREAIGVLF